MDKYELIDVTFDELNLYEQIEVLKETSRLFKQRADCSGNPSNEDDPNLVEQILSMIEGLEMPQLIPGFNIIEGEA